MSVDIEPWLHGSAIVEGGVQIGVGTKVWDSVHIRTGARIGRSCIIGEKSYVAYDVVIGDFVKLNASVYVCAGVTIEDFCMVSAHTVFTNDRFPRAGNRDLTGLETSAPTEDTKLTLVKRGSTIGANATIGPGVILGEFSMVGMGSVVTRHVPDFALVIGNPAHQVGWVCMCGAPIQRWGEARPSYPEERTSTCEHCKRAWTVSSEGVRRKQGS